MPRDSQGEYSFPFNWPQDEANGIGIEADRHQQGDDDLGQGLTDSLDRQGRGGMQADLAMGNNIIKGLNEGSAATDAANIGQLQVGAFTYSSTEPGSANAYQAVISPSPTAYSEGLLVRFKATNANTGASTLQVGALVPAQPLEWNGAALVGGEIPTSATVVCQYDGTAFQILNVPQVLQAAQGGTGTTTALGTAAFQNTGTAIGDVVLLEDVGGSAGLPAVDGSQLTGIATVVRGQLSGIGLSKTAAQSVQFAVGQAVDSAAAFTMDLTAALTKTFASFTEGDNNGGLFSGSVANNTWYHCHVIRKDADGTIDCGFDTSPTAANIPTGFTAYRRVGSVKTDGASNVLDFFQYGDRFWWQTVPALDVDAVNPGAAAVTWTATVPTGIEIIAHLNGQARRGSGPVSLYISSLKAADQQGDLTASPLGSLGMGIGASGDSAFGMAEVLVNTSGQARYRCETSDAQTTVRICTIGWLDRRGRG